MKTKRYGQEITSEDGSDAVSYAIVVDVLNGQTFEAVGKKYGMKKQSANQRFWLTIKNRPFKTILTLNNKDINMLRDEWNKFHCQKTTKNRKISTGYLKYITQQYLKNILEYNKETGLFRWIEGRNHLSKKGDISGYKSREGYVYIGINGIGYRAHRLAWLYVYGEFPSRDIDHINKIKDDNRIINLREVTSSVSNINRNRPKNNKTGIRGVITVGNSFRSKMYINGKEINLYRGKDFDEAVYYRLAAEQCYYGEELLKNSDAYKYIFTR